MEQVLNSKKVLIVEDDSYLSSLMLGHLKDKGFDVHLAINAEKGLETAREILPDIILLDIILPKMDGYEFLKTIKAEEKLSSIPIIILSNLGQKDEIDRGFKLGATDFLVKSNFDLDEIAEKVKKVLK